jgi:hypothetical protein
MTRSQFIVVEHDAKKARLHWDLRFKMPKSSKWASFAIRKGIPTVPGKKVLAVKTHDHSRAEALFIGIIKDGYGAGKLKKWDDGSCIIHKYSPSHIAIELKGRKVKGMYHLISTGVVDRNYKRQTYFLFKGKVISEWFGMISRIPGLWADEVEEGPSEWESKKLPWSKARTLIKNDEQVRESFGSLSPGLVGKAPPSDTQDVESDNEAEDRKLDGPLPWSLRKHLQMIRSKEVEYDHDD